MAKQQTTQITLTPLQVAKETGFGINHTYLMLRDGRLPSIRVGKRFFIPRAALNRWLESCGQAQSQ